MENKGNLKIARTRRVRSSNKWRIKDMSEEEKCIGKKDT